MIVILAFLKLIVLCSWRNLINQLIVDIFFQSLFDKMNKTSAAGGGEKNGVAGGETNGGKRLSVERIYQKKSQLEHILLRPDTCIGSVEPLKDVMWVYEESAGMVQREITYVPSLYKIFDEILVNAADNKVRDLNMDTIKVDIDP